MISKQSIRIFAVLMTLMISTTTIFAQKMQNRTDSCLIYLKKEIKKFNKTKKDLDGFRIDDFTTFLFPYNRNYSLDSNNKEGDLLKKIILLSDEALTKAQTQSDMHCYCSLSSMQKIFFLKAEALFYTKKYQEAATIYQHLTTLKDGDTAFFSAVRIIDCMLAEYQYEQASAAMEELEIAQKEMTGSSERYLCAKVDFYLQTQQWDAAMTTLKSLLNLDMQKDLKTRLRFILGQLQEQNHQYQAAIDNYKIVFNSKKYSPLMTSYSHLHQHICQKEYERFVLDSIATEQWKRENPIPTTFEPTLVESTIEHSLSEEYPYYFNDIASKFFLEDVDINFDDSLYLDDTGEDELSDETLALVFENWDSVAIHIPKTDFSNMKDTIYLPLVEEGYQLPQFNDIVSKFGWRRRRYHYGVDTKNKMGDSIYSAFDGIVRIATRNRTYGNIVIIRHYNGLETFYAHCTKLLVNSNQVVKAGELVALVGSTGRSTGPHLHFETRYKGAPINPELIIDFENKKLHSDTLVITKETFNYRKSRSYTPSSGGGTYYTVRSGDTLSAIAQRNRTSVGTIKKLNGLRSDFIRDGQRLKIR